MGGRDDPDGSAEPALVGPWTMGRNKVDPKPLDAAAFQTLVKTASEVIRRHEQQLHARLNKQCQIETEAGSVSVRLAVTPDEYEPFGTLTAVDSFGEVIASVKVPADFRLTRECRPLGRQRLRQDRPARLKAGRCPGRIGPAMP